MRTHFYFDASAQVKTDTPTAPTRSSSICSTSSRDRIVNARGRSASDDD